MAIPWIRLLNAAIGVAAIARRSGRPLIGFERGDRDDERLDVETRQLELERERAERALRLELVRQAGDRELIRLRLLAALALASWLGSLVFASAARLALGLGWLLLLLALAASFSAQSRMTRSINRIVMELEASVTHPGMPSSGWAGALAPWLIVAGLGVIAIGMLVT